jgi:hypothetical protein
VELPDGHAERLAGDVPERELDPGDRHLRGPVGRLPRPPIHVDVVLLDGGRILPDQPLGEVLHEPDEPARDPIAPELAVAGEAVVGADRTEEPGPRRLEPGLDDERLDVGDLHEGLLGRTREAYVDIVAS